MISISLCMIVKDEEAVLARCLESIKDIVDEIIIVDTGSTDKTVEIAKKYTTKVYHFQWCDDFSKARNYSFSKATKDYILWLDADDIITEENQKKLLSLKKTISKDVDIVMMQYHIAFDEMDNPTFSYYRERLIKRAKNYQWISPVHEVIELSGNILYSDIAISHKKVHVQNPERNLAIFRKMKKNHIELDPRQQFYYARELYYHQEYEQAITEFNHFLDSQQGWTENCISACLDLSKCYVAVQQNELALDALLKSFKYDTPRAEICCHIGKHFLEKSQFQQAIFWYELATKQKPDTTSGGFYNLEYYHYIPYMQLCVCYDKLGNYEIANEYNEKAGKIKPNDIAYLSNQQYFHSILNS